MDSIDVAICNILGTGKNATVVLSSLYTHKYPKDLQSRVRALSKTSIQEVSELHLELGRLFGAAVNEALVQSSKNKLEDLPLDLIGSHGQTVYHHSRLVNRRLKRAKGKAAEGPAGEAVKSSLQLGCGEAIAEATGVPVVFNFRARDIAAGGEGAPLTPYADAVLFKAHDESKAVLNLGGIANITLLSNDPGRIFGFDCGPANAPLDRLARLVSNGASPSDIDGAWARAGIANQEALKTLIESDTFVNLAPPKSTGFEMYGDEFVQRLIGLHPGGVVDNSCLATAVEFVSYAVVRAIEISKRDPKEIVVAGGGLQNQFLIERIKAKAPNIDFVSSEKYHVPPQAREAMAFALFANEWLMGSSVSLPAVTGVLGPRVLGSLALGAARA